jgi:hypothetical protein
MRRDELVARWTASSGFAENRARESLITIKHEENEMRRNRFYYAMTIVALLVPTTSPAQKETSRSLRSNPYRDIGGSCVYGKQGEVLYAPKGAQCADRTEHLAAPAPAAAQQGRFNGLPPAYQPEARKLVADHDHIAEELTRLRQAIARNQKEGALQMADKLIAELTQHLQREESFLEKLEAEHETH